ncbi:MAG TPA: hypothetical protein VEA69_13145 [Tepidisphaeraceae bacterium]|nr:hypothetical protein [Tepidisphaeraceae bacterium]
MNILNWIMNNISVHTLMILFIVGGPMLGALLKKIENAKQKRLAKARAEAEELERLRTGRAGSISSPPERAAPSEQTPFLSRAETIEARQTPSPTPTPQRAGMTRIVRLPGGIVLEVPVDPDGSPAPAPTPPRRQPSPTMRQPQRQAAPPRQQTAQRPPAQVRPPQTKPQPVKPQRQQKQRAAARPVDAPPPAPYARHTLAHVTTIADAPDAPDAHVPQHLSIQASGVQMNAPVGVRKDVGVLAGLRGNRRESLRQAVVLAEVFGPPKGRV